MQISDVIKNVANLLQLQKLINFTAEDITNLDDQSKRDANIILSSINEVLSEISTDYIPLKKTERITIENGEFNLDNLSEVVHEVLDLNGAEFNIYENYILANSGSYEITYMYLLPIKNFSDEITEFGGKLTIYALSYGVASEYCIICGNYSESEMWNSKYQNAMQVLTRTNKIPELKARRWQ